MKIAGTKNLHAAVAVVANVGLNILSLLAVD